MFRYNRIYPEQLGRIRVLRISDRPDRSMDVQNVSRNGHVLASLRTAKVHTIVCEMLVLGRSRTEVQITLERLRRWLLDSGTAELDTAPGKVCLASCTGISAPDYKGHSASVSVTFTCRNADNSEPETDGFTFAGKHVTRDLGCLFLLEKMNPVPTVTPYKLSIPGLPGTIRYEEMPEPQEKTLTGSLYLLRGPEDSDTLLSQEDMIQRLRQLSTWLVMSGRADLIWDSEPGVTWQAEFASAEFDRQEWNNGRLRIQMILQPVGIGQEVSTTVQVSMRENEAYTLDLSGLFPNGTGYLVPVDLTIQCVSGTVGRISLWTGDNEDPFIMGGSNFALGSGDVLQILASERIVFLNGRPAGLYVSAGDYPVMPIEDLHVTIMTDSDAGLKVTAQLCPRYI